jgi:hypothetical protein
VTTRCRLAAADVSKESFLKRFTRRCVAGRAVLEALIRHDPAPACRC